MSKKITKLEKKVKQLEKRIAVLEGQVQAQQKVVTIKLDATQLKSNLDEILKSRNYQECSQISLRNR